jgi:hypothetical protein
MSNQALQIEQTFQTLGGRNTCQQCQAMSKRTKQQCRAPAMKGKRVCRTHGGKSTGPKTQAGRQRCADARTIHGNETRQARTDRFLEPERSTETNSTFKPCMEATVPSKKKGETGLYSIRARSCPITRTDYCSATYFSQSTFIVASKGWIGKQFSRVPPPSARA